MKRFLACTLTAVGALTLLLAAFAAIAAAIALSERLRFDPGLMFADVEILAILALFLAAAGAILLWAGRKLNRPLKPDAAP